MGSRVDSHDRTLHMGSRVDPGGSRIALDVFYFPPIQPTTSLVCRTIPVHTVLEKLFIIMF